MVVGRGEDRLERHLAEQEDGERGPRATGHPAGAQGEQADHARHRDDDREDDPRRAGAAAPEVGAERECGAECRRDRDTVDRDVRSVPSCPHVTDCR
ncbi:hypothetical protein GCM10023201_27180 [Actinomycetospora corticicola]